MENKGIKTSEFWLSLTALLVAGVLFVLETLGAVDGNGYSVVAFVASALSSLGYSWSRGKVKSASILAGAAKSDPSTE